MAPISGRSTKWALDLSTGLMRVLVLVIVVYLLWPLLPVLDIV